MIIQQTFVKQVIIDIEFGNIGWQTVIKTIDTDTLQEVAPRGNHRGSFDADVPDNEIPFPQEVLDAVNLAVVRSPAKVAAAAARRAAAIAATLGGLPPGPTV